MRVLIVEDEERLANTVARGLGRYGMAVDVSLDGNDGLLKAMANDYDVVVLDRDLPGRHGDDVCRRIRAEGRRAGIIMLTASGEVESRVEGLRIGADDYLPKPFAFDELVARIQALSRRSQPPVPPILSRAGISLDPARREASRKGEALHLTNKEFGVLEVLLAAEGRVVSSEELLERVWDEFTDPFTTVVRVTVGTLRKKLGDPPVIHTVVGQGYQI
ncbi:MAG: response regulator transcription factor [Acidimicrobiia bacterium]